MAVKPREHRPKQPDEFVWSKQTWQELSKLMTETIDKIKSKRLSQLANRNTKND